MALGSNGTGGQGVDVSSLRFEITNLKGRLDVKEAELKAVSQQLESKQAELQKLADDPITRDTRLEAELRLLRQDLEQTQIKLVASEGELTKLRREAALHDSADADNEEKSRLEHELRRVKEENRQMRECIEQLNKEKAEAAAKAKSLDAKILHAAAEAELTRMGHGGVVDGWSTTSVVVLSSAAAVAGGFLVSYMKKKSN